MSKKNKGKQIEEINEVDSVLENEAPIQDEPIVEAQEDPVALVEQILEVNDTINEIVSSMTIEPKTPVSIVPFVYYNSTTAVIKVFLSEDNASVTIKPGATRIFKIELKEGEYLFTHTIGNHIFLRTIKRDDIPVLTGEMDINALETLTIRKYS